MTGASEAQERVDAYLGRLRQLLRGMNAEDAHEIVEELRSHIIDKAAARGQATAAGVDAALAMLGKPEELASQYMTDDLLARAEVSRSPVRILESLFRWASLSAVGFFVLLSSIVGYFLGGAFMWCAVLKIIHPQTAGLWVLPGGADDYEISLRLGFASPPVGGRDLLGWWIVPVGLVVGCGLVMLTTRFALWCGGQYRRSLALPAGLVFSTKILQGKK
jgi:HAAS domain-containing protein